MSISITMPGALSDLDKLFAATDLLDNTNELIAEFKPEVKKYLVKDGFFSGRSRLLYEAAFDDLIVTLIKRQITQHFPTFTPEEILLLCDQEFLKMIAPELFNKTNYKEVISE